MKWLLVCAAFIGTALLATTPVAGSETKDHVCFTVVDADKNGEVNYSEYQAYFGDDRKGFDAADLDKNGTLSHDEYHERLGHGARSS
jgi:hypothetical protein